MQTDILRLPGAMAADESLRLADADEKTHNQWSYPVVGQDDVLLGIVTLNVLRFRNRAPADASAPPPLLRIMHKDPVFALPDDSLRSVVYRMARTGIPRLPVVTAELPRRVLGMITLADLLKARTQHLEDEQRREQILPLPFLPADPRTTRRFKADCETAEV
ncbi:MAG: CBS domain-containing protein [Planctomycetaceae bacterium]|nr:CBS domain-containing protein [Planctomycetaceae bacterium]